MSLALSLHCHDGQNSHDQGSHGSPDRPSGRQLLLVAVVAVAVAQIDLHIHRLLPGCDRDGLEFSGALFVVFVMGTGAAAESRLWN